VVRQHHIGSHDRGPSEDSVAKMRDDLLLGRGGSKDRLDGGPGNDTATADTLGSVVDLLIDVETVT